MLSCELLVPKGTGQPAPPPLHIPSHHQLPRTVGVRPGQGGSREGVRLGRSKLGVSSSNLKDTADLREALLPFLEHQHLR